MSLLEPPQELLSLLRESLPDSVTAEEGKEESLGSEDILSYVAFLAAGLCEVQEFTPSTWQDVLKPHLEEVNNSMSEESVEKFRDSALKATMGDNDDEESYGDEDEDGYEEICNIRFK